MKRGMLVHHAHHTLHTPHSHDEAYAFLHLFEGVVRVVLQA